MVPEQCAAWRRPWLELWKLEGWCGPSSESWLREVALSRRERRELSERRRALRWKQSPGHSVASSFPARAAPGRECNSDRSELRRAVAACSTRDSFPRGASAIQEKASVPVVERWSLVPA